MSTPDFKLFTLFALIVACIVLRVSVEKTGYRSPDSADYLEVAQNIVDGKGFYYSTGNTSTPNLSEKLSYFAIWPLGYPLLISAFALIFPTSVFWASKLVNIFFLGLCFLLFRKMNNEKAYLLSLIMCSFTFLEVFSYTWSEAPFVFGILWFVYLVHRFLQDENNNKYILLLFLCSLFLFLIRYIGGISFVILGGISAWFFLRKNLKPALRLFFITILLSSIAGLYLYNNYLQTGYLTGGERFYPDRESLGLFTWYLFVGLFNEFFIIRNYYWRGENPDSLFWFTSIIQIFLITFVYLKYLKEESVTISLKSNLIILYVAMGFIYLIVLTFLRFFSPFEPFDYRLLSPFSICIYTAFFLFLTDANRSANIVGAYKYIILFFVASLILNLPKTYLVETLWNLIPE